MVADPDERLLRALRAQGHEIGEDAVDRRQILGLALLQIDRIEVQAVVAALVVRKEHAVARRRPPPRVDVFAGEARDGLRLRDVVGRRCPDVQRPPCTGPSHPMR